MLTIKQLREMRGMTQKELADAAGVLPQNLHNYEAGLKKPGYKMLPVLSEILRVSAAYLSGRPELLPVYDPLGHTAALCPIVSADEQAHADGTPYGVYYLVEHPGLGSVLAVILSDGLQFTPKDWQGRQPLTAGEIPSVQWMDNAARDAVMLDGLPHTAF